MCIVLGDRSGGSVVSKGGEKRILKRNMSWDAVVVKFESLEEF